jgi:hypothetical protein
MLIMAVMGRGSPGMGVGFVLSWSVSRVNARVILGMVGSIEAHRDAVGV